MAGRLASARILLLHSPLSADSCSLFHSVMFIAFMHCGVRLLQLVMLPEIILILLKMNLYFCAF